MLLYFFLCNICLIILYVNGWGNDFCLFDRSVLVNIEWICLKRNEYGYSLKFYIIEKEFKKIF